MVDPNIQCSNVVTNISWDADFTGSIVNFDQASFIEAGIDDYEFYEKRAKQKPYGLYMVLKTSTVYNENIVDSLADYLKAQGCSEACVCDFISIAQELVMNAVVHGNLGLDVNFLQMRADNPAEITGVFDRFQQMLKDDEYANKAIAMGVTCYDGSVLFEIQDQGPGFAFDDFKDKYNDTSLHKGMDIVFLLTADIEYSEKDNILRIILSDKENEIDIDDVLNMEDIRIGVTTTSETSYKIIRSILAEHGIKYVSRFNILQNDLVNSLEQIDLLLFLSDRSTAVMLDRLKKIRHHKTQVEFPIILQKTEALDSVQMGRFSPFVNDFIGQDMAVYELVSRIRAHYSMYAAQKALLNVYKEYQREIVSARHSIQRIESLSSSVLERKSTGTKFLSFVQGSKTFNAVSEQIERFSQRRASSYGQGFCFTLNERPYSIFISMPEGLSSVLILSHVKGYIEHLKQQDDIAELEEIIESILSYSRRLASMALNIKIICAYWAEDEGTFYYQNVGGFIAVEYNILTRKASVYKGDKNSYSLGKDKKYKPSAQNIFYIFDHFTPIQLADVEAHSHLLLKARSFWSDEQKIAVPDFVAKEQKRIPYFSICPLDETEESHER